MIKRLVLVVLALFMLYAPASEALNQHDANLVNQVTHHFRQSSSSINNYDYTQAFQSIKTAKNHAKNIKDWRVRTSLQTQIFSQLITLGIRFYDTKKYQDSLATFKLAHELYPHNPLLNYEIGLTYRALKKDWDATLAFYEALYYNHLPSFRWVTDPIDDSNSFRAPPDEINQMTVKQLQEMGKPSRYPIDLVLKQPQDIPKDIREIYSVGKKIRGRVIPGMGAALIGSKGNVDLYLNDSITKLTDVWGEPDRKVERGELTTYDYDEEGCFVDVKPGNLVGSILLTNPLYHVQVNNHVISIQAPAKFVMDKLGQRFAFEKEYVGGQNIREGLRYNDFGLTFGVGYGDTVGYIHIWTME